MSKRKAGVNDIIYELDNDDIELSSEDEAKVAKMNRLDSEGAENVALSEFKNEKDLTEVISVEIPDTDTEESTSPPSTHNGGKISPKSSNENTANSVVIMNTHSPGPHDAQCQVNSGKKLDRDGSKTTIYHEDIIIDSPASNSDLGVVGCENRTPLVTVRFRDRKLASSYKNKLKKFMLNLIKLHEDESSPGLESETDIELDIWPEDLNDENSEEESESNNQANLFFIDTDPCSNAPDEVPTYKKVSTLISNNENREASPPPVLRRGPTCFNCDGPHPLRDCSMARNNSRIAEKRKQIMGTRVGRYHVEDEQKYGHLIPGRISGQLRHALGLKRHELPLYIYRMRLLGYPPGWLEEARISHSGITMFDSTGAAILDPEEEDGEVCEPGSKDKFDIKKILDFPGFNVPASTRYREEAHLFGLPPMSEQDSKIAMLQMLAPNAMKAYKRKKLTLFPSASNNVTTQEVAEMDLDSGDETVAFPSVPPLPDDAPPPPPPPPPKSPSPEPTPPGTCSSPVEVKPSTPKASSSSPGAKPSPPGTKISPQLSLRANELERLEDKENAELSSGRGSPSLNDLEEKKRLLLSALEGDDISLNISNTAESDNEKIDDNVLETSEPSIDEGKDTVNETDMIAESNLKVDIQTSDKDSSNASLSPSEMNNASVENAMSTPESKTGHVKTTLYGTPVMNIASSYVKLPSDDKFAKDICDVINFENLPNSTGKYKKICNILKRVKTEVDRIQES